MNSSPAGPAGPVSVGRAASVGRTAETLAAGYKGWHRTLDIMGVGTFTLLLAWQVARLAWCGGTGRLLLPAAALVGMAAADFASGFVHWACDTWGNADMPILGSLFLRPFREHHVNPKSIVAHDFLEANGHNFFLASLPLAAALAFGFDRPESVAIGLTLTCFAAFTALTSQIHKWAHMESPPRIIAILQRGGLLLGRAHHDVHHSGAFDDHYCITVGWLNVPLSRIGFFRRLERCITALTGVEPRRDDRLGH